MTLTADQKAIVTSTVPLLETYGLEITKTFYHNLLTDYPSLKDVFSLSAQLTDRQAKALAGAVYAYAANINDLAPILPVVERINQKHASLNISAPQYAIVGEYLIKALRQVLTIEVFTAAVDAAWGAAYWQLANLMIKRETEIYENQEFEIGGWSGWRQMRLVRKVPESSEITSFYWIPVDGGALPTYKPGQYISIRTDVPGGKQIRQYSLSDAPPLPNTTKSTTSDLPAQYFRNSIKREDGNIPGLVSNTLHTTLQEGDIVEMTNPAGDFFLPLPTDPLTPQPKTPLVLISAGVGQTPLLSILNTLTHPSQSPCSRRISYIHTARSTQTHAFAPHIKNLVLKHPDLSCVTFHSQPAEHETQGSDYDYAGRLDMDVLDPNKDLCLDDSQTEYFVCGPGKFMMEVAAWLVKRGVEDSRVKMEVFGTGV